MNRDSNLTLKCIPWQMPLCVALGILLSMAPRVAAAQLAPTGGHYAGRASDTGHQPGMVNASGGYAASVPLDLPAARGGLPVPLQITSGARGVGAAGLGWDVPLSYVRRNNSFAGRRPAWGKDVRPSGREQVSLSIMGRDIDLVRKGTEWVARRDAPALLLREQNGTWILVDGQGRTYLFTTPSALSGTDLWLLSTVTGPGGTRLQLDYDVATPALTGGTGISIDLARISYNTHPQTGCAKHEVTLTYGETTPSPLSLSMFGAKVLARMRTLDTVDVNSRASCSGSPELLRRYKLNYLPDADTQQLRLHSVRMFGRQGTPEANTAIPVAEYTYGSATYVSASNTRKLRYEKTQSIALPPDADSAKISSTMTDSTVVLPQFWGASYATWQSLTDVTGDGRPDLVFPKNGKLWVAHNRPSTDGTTAFDALSTGELSDSTFSIGPFETRTMTNNRFAFADNGNIDKVWRQAIDVNGDGRIDIIDAGEQAGQWVIYLNTPDVGASGVKWVRRSISIANLYHHMRLRGLDVNSNYVPLASRFTGHDRFSFACLQYTGGGSAGWVNAPAGSCSGTAPPSISQERTYTEWELIDINGDGYPDFVFNSSPVGLFIDWPDPAPVGTVINTTLVNRVGPRNGEANKVDAVLNLRGVLFQDDDIQFSTPITIRANSECGVRLWVSDSFQQQAVCTIADVNGDGLPDRIEGRRVFLGTGSVFSRLELMLPGVFAIQHSDQVLSCVSPDPAPPDTIFGASQTAGMRDLTGDGIPDYIERHGSTWWVSIGTGTGFAAPIEIEGFFSISHQDERCDGKASSTTAGLYDIDGDGKPDGVHLNGQSLDVYQLTGGAVPRTPEAGRLVQLDNGYGAKTSIGYRSAKEDGTTLHQVPFPEIVVSSVETTGSHGLGGTLSAIQYAYGGAQLMFDSALDAFTLPGYRRSVELRGVVEVQYGIVEGVATLTDTYGLAPFVPTDKNERFGQYLRAGRVSDVTVISGSLAADPWAMLTIDISTDSHRIASTHYDLGTRLFEEPAAPGINLDCIEIMYPFDFIFSLFGSVGYNVCSSHGFAFARATESWRGTAAPPSTANVATRSEVREIDDFGRVTSTIHQKDRHRSDDDICVDTEYALPTVQNERVLSAPSSRRIWDCTKPNFPTYATGYWEYDNLPFGSVSAGLVTSYSVDRRATNDGTLLNTVRTFDASYNVAGNLIAITRKREDGASRKETLEYEPFGLATVRATVDATGTPPIQISVARDPISLYALSTTGVNQTQRGTDFDGFGRVVLSTVTPPGGSVGVVSALSYLGFSGADPLGRRIVGTSFSDPVPPGSVGVTVGRTGTVYLDELGRERRTELALGTDYSNEMLITGARVYDNFGRVAFEADPFPSSQDAATAYGTTYLFKTDGSPSCFIRGSGPQLFSSVTDELNERYPTCFTRSFLDHQETLEVSDAAALLPGSLQAGVTKRATLTAIGRLVSRSTWKGGMRLEYATLTHDRLGQLVGMTRFQDAVSGINPVEWSWQFDSLGQILQLREPESAPRFSQYSNWGELLEVRWTDATTLPSADHRLITHYDALGRATHREERNNGVTDPETRSDYAYDVGVSVAPQVVPTHVLGRLAEAKASTGAVFFSYDALGRVNARTFIDRQDSAYVEKTTVHADGTPSTLELFMPDTGYQQERVDYRYDSAARLRSMQFLDGSTSKTLYDAADIDPFGRVRKASYGGNVDYRATYGDVGRRLMNEVTVSSALGSRRTLYLGYDPLGRERVRREIKDGATGGPNTNVEYDALGRLTSALQTDGATTLSSWHFTYDALGNVLGLTDLLGGADATLRYRTGDRDRVCRIGYGPVGLGGTACNVVYDGVGNTVEQVTRTGLRTLSYFASGNVRSIAEGTREAHFRYDAFGSVQEIDLVGSGTTNTRHDRRYGGLIERHDHVVGGSASSFISREIPAPGGIVASRRGPGNEWVFTFGEPRGNRFFIDVAGAFVQDVDYQPYGEATSSGLLPGSALYTNSQWNGGDALGDLGLFRLGARVYDPAIGRFLSRDPLLVPRTAATTNPYAFALNDPLNLSDPSGLDCIGKECQGPGGNGVPGGGPTPINDPRLYFPSGGATPGGANPQAAHRPANPTIFSSPPEGSQDYSRMWPVWHKRDYWQRYGGRFVESWPEETEESFADQMTDMGNFAVAVLEIPFHMAHTVMCLGVCGEAGENARPSPNSWQIFKGAVEFGTIVGPGFVARTGAAAVIPAEGGQKLLPQFTATTVDDVVASAARARSAQITEGARAIAKKLGHAESSGYTSALQGIAPTQANAESLIRNIMSNPSRTFYGGKVIDIYNAAGQGVRIESGSGRFMGFLEGALATQ